VSFIHKRVDRLVDTIFFRKRHEAEARLRDFALDAPYMTDGSVLLRRCVELVRTCAETNDAAVWLRDGSRYTQAEGTFAGAIVDENDAAIVAMRARHVVAELQPLRSTLPGVLGFPMTVRGQLVGVLLCGAKVEDETYAPDERESLAGVATAVAQALDGLRVTRLEETVERLLARHPESATQGAMGTF
jgi:GAF domain-containing protein